MNNEAGREKNPQVYINNNNKMFYSYAQVFHIQ